MSRMAPACLLALLLLPPIVPAQERPGTILVLDGSGSMWGQVDGVTKIAIARQVVAEVLSDFPGDQNLGLTVYGHRTRGDCSDIETVIAPGTGTASRIIEVVNSITPRGKTPMTDAIIRAAEALRYTEEKASVVLVSDGIETCNPDPCAAMRVLEQAGVDFTAHVIGFDVDADPDAMRQMQCIADETGGTFTTAGNASELSAALAVVVEPEPVGSSATFTAVVDGRGPVTDPVLWDLTGPGGPVVSGVEGNPLELSGLVPGEYSLLAYWTVAESARKARFTVTGPEAVAVEVAFPPPAVEVTLSARIGGPDGVEITDPVLWEITPEGSADPGDPANPARVALPRGAYTAIATWTVEEVSEQVDFVVMDSPREIRVSFDEPVPSASIIAPASGVAGATIDVGWTGPEERNDFIAIRVPDATGFHRFINETAIRDGNPLRLLLPTAPGDYLVEYVQADGREALAASPITVTAAEASVVAPASASAGATIEVGWTGPDYRNDFIGVRSPDATGFHRFINDVPTDRGSPARLILPVEPGSYVIEYVVSQGRVAIAEVPIEVTPVGADLVAPATAPAGATIEVGWTGPDYDNDFIAVRSPDATGFHRFINDVPTDRGSPARLVMPTEPGSYVIEYVVSQGRVAIAEAPIEVTPVGAGLVAPASAPAGATIEVGWTGPDYDNDFIAVRSPDATGFHRFINSSRTSDGSPLRLLMPSAPGNYLIEYIVAQDRVPLAAWSIDLAPVTASLVAPATAVAGSSIEVGWSGPDYANDFIAIREPSATGYHRFAHRTRTERGMPLQLRMPDDPGTYLIEYIEGQDRTPLAVHEITVTPGG